ncbi:MAG: methyltransferase domain-containing protein [Roseiflexaceae bacterium]
MSVETSRIPELEQAAQTMPFDQFGRYHMLREAVDACRAHLGAETLSILDVGGFYEDNGVPTLPAKRFLPADELTVLDVVACDLPGYIRGDGAALEFPDASFDLVVSVDTLEHIPRARRLDFWRELLRVAQHGVIVLAPFGTPDVELAEELLFEYIKTELGAEHQQLKEHREYGLPVLDEWLDHLKRQQITARAYPTGYLHAWTGMMLLKHMVLRVDAGARAQQLLDSYYNRCFFSTERRNPAYRHLIVAEKTLGLAAAVDAVLAPTLMPDLIDPGPGLALSALPAMLAIVERQLGAMRQEHNDQYRQQVSILERIIADQQIMINQLSGDMRALQGLLAEQEARASGEQELSEAAIHDLSERSRWLEGQNNALRSQIEAIQNGRVVRTLNALSGRKNP